MNLEFLKSNFLNSNSLNSSLSESDLPDPNPHPAVINSALRDPLNLAQEINTNLDIHFVHTSDESFSSAASSGSALLEQ
jgi:hypothetical protein